MPLLVVWRSFFSCAYPTRQTEYTAPLPEIHGVLVDSFVCLSPLLTPSQSPLPSLMKATLDSLRLWATARGLVSSLSQAAGSRVT